MTPEVSVILPVYNGASYLDESIVSILEQTFTDFELIIINDGSTDDSISVIKKFTDPRIRVIDQINKGLAAALNIGISVSQGKYIARMDQDDISRIDRLQSQVSFLNKNSNITVLSGAVIYIDNHGNELARSFPLTSFFAIKKYLLNYGCVITHPAVMMRRKELIDIGGYCESIGGRFTDYHLWVKFIRKGFKILNLPEEVIKYRLLDVSMSSEFSLTKDSRQVLLELLKIDDPEGNDVKALYDMFKKENSGMMIRLEQLEKIPNNLYKVLRVINKRLAERVICGLKNIYAIVR